ncbi:MAG TPA: RNA polymerase sigma factor [Candidatus Sumerlaeota bacterium]|nr:RNA polymerase sigma factor [Candidatus Sumerlaeota bacterium]
MDIGDCFDQNYASLYRFAWRMLGCSDRAQDAAQEAFLRLARRGCDGWDALDLRRWLFVVVRNLCLTELRARLRHPEMPLDDVEAWQAGTGDPAQSALENERADQVRNAISQLPPLLRETLILREYEGLSYADIAAITDTEPGTVKSRLARAREALRIQLTPFFRENAPCDGPLQHRKNSGENSSPNGSTASSIRKAPRPLTTT